MDRYSDYYSDADDRGSDLSALDFSSHGGVDEPSSDAAALDFSAAEEPVESDGFALDEYAPADPVDDDSDLDAIDPLAEDAAPEEDPLDPFRFTVTNPPESVSVTALIGGRLDQIELSPKVTSMSEAELADEIRVLANLAQQKAMAGQTTYLMESDLLADSMGSLGVDSQVVVRDFMENGMGFPTAQAAEAAQAEVFATRYTRDDE